MTKIGPLELNTVLCSKCDDKLENYKKKTLGQLVCAEILGIKCILACHLQFLARKHVVPYFGSHFYQRSVKK